MKTVSIFWQVALFADASPIAANPTTIKELMELFADRSFLPGVLQELVAGPLTVTVAPLPGPIGQRLSLDESGTGYHIDFGSQRIDIEQRARDLDAANMGPTADFIRTATDLARRIMTRFELLATRLAIVRRNLVLDVSDKHLVEIY